MGFKRELTIKYHTQIAYLTGGEDIDTINIENVAAGVGRSTTGAGEDKMVSLMFSVLLWKKHRYCLHHSGDAEVAEWFTGQRSSQLRTAPGSFCSC